MAQNSDVSLHVVRYTRADFTALRALMNKVPLERILDLYYCEDDRFTLGLEETTDLKARLDEMREYLIQRATDTNPHVATFLQDARATSVWSRSAIDFLVEGADMKMSSPRPDDPVSFWFRGPIANRLKEDDCRTIEDLANIINKRGRNWYLPIACIGELKARAIVGWFMKQHTIKDLIDERSLLPVVSQTAEIEYDPMQPRLLPIGILRLPYELSGATGTNRCHDFGQIGAKDDIAAIKAYLVKHNADDYPKTHRSYRKELERYLLWCVTICKKPLSSITIEDCESYKQFLANPDTSWIGNQRPHLGAPRNSQYWRPFKGIPSEKSQCYAVSVIRTFYAFLVNVRYLAGNPWKAVRDPKSTTLVNKMRIERALSTTLWKKLSGPGGILDQLCVTPEEELAKRYKAKGYKNSIAAQFRVARAALMLMGESGLRREEAVTATRKTLLPAKESKKHHWELTIIGKGNKERTVFFPRRVVDAILAHWDDRGQDLEMSHEDTPLFSPVIIPETDSAKDRHALIVDKASGKTIERGYNPDSLGRLVATTLTRISEDSTLDLEYEERLALSAASAHALRHTFGTKSVAAKKPLDVVQFLMGHASLNTTSIYVQAPRTRAIEELEKDYEE